MRLRHLALPALAACLVASPATAAPKPVCNLLTDVSGDGQWDIAPVVESPALDILSGDIATGPKQVVGVLRLAGTDFSGDRWANLGYRWSMGATSSLGTNYAFNAARGMTGNLTFSASVDGTSVTLTEGKIDKNTFVWKFDRKLSPSLTRPKNVFSAFRAESEVQSSTADTAGPEIKKKYADRASSCVKAL